MKRRLLQQARKITNLLISESNKEVNRIYRLTIDQVGECCEIINVHET